MYISSTLAAKLKQCLNCNVGNNISLTSANRLKLTTC